MESRKVTSLASSELLNKAAAYLSENDERLGRVVGRFGALEFRPSTDLFFSIAESILSQQLTPKAADSIIRRFVTIFPGGRVTPSEMMRMNEDTVRSCGISRQKSSYLKNLAENVIAGSLATDELDGMNDEEVTERLVRIKGVGTWTAKMILIFSLGRPDVLPFEDVGLLNAMQRVYLLEGKPDRDTVERIAENWHPYCSVASLYLWKLKDELPWEKDY